MNIITIIIITMPQEGKKYTKRFSIYHEIFCPRICTPEPRMDEKKITHLTDRGLLSIAAELMAAFEPVLPSAMVT